MRTRGISASNAVVNAIDDTAALYGVRCYRMQSRAFQVVGAGGRPRPMFMGQWKDRTGQPYFKGMADLLLTPRCTATIYDGTGGLAGYTKITVPLWVECKAGKGRLSDEQKAFRDDVLDSGAFYIEAHDSALPVVEWFERMGVKR